MAKVIKIREYRGTKIRSGDKVVLHLTDNKGDKIHLHLTWVQLRDILADLPIK